MTVSPEYNILVDWDNDGSFVATYDDVTGYTDGETGVTIDAGLDVAQVTHPPKLQASDFELYNDDGLFSGEDPSSPLYQTVLPGRAVRMSASRGSQVVYRRHVLYRSHTRYRGRETWSLHQGVIADIRQRAAFGDRRVALSTLGASSVLRGKRVSVGWQEDITTGEALELLLDIAGWPQADRVLDAGDTVLEYWWVEDQDAWEAALTLVRSEGPCQFYEDSEGRIHFEARSYRSLNTRSTTVQASFYDNLDDATANSGLWFTSLLYEPSWNTVVNRAAYAITARDSTPAANTQVWELGRDFSMGSTDQPVEFIIRPSDPFINAETPAEGNDYAVTGGTVSMTLSAFSGLVATLTVTVTSGSPTISGVTSNGIRVRAQPISRLSDTTVVSSTDASESVMRYGERSLDVNGWREVDPAVALGVANSWVTRRSAQRPRVTIEVRNADEAHLQAMLDLEVSDRVYVSETNTGLDGDFWVESRRLVIGGLGGRVMAVQFTLEKCLDIAGYAWDDLDSLWDSATWGE